MNCISRQTPAIRLSAFAFSLLILVTACAGVPAQAQTYTVSFPSPTTFATFDCPPQSYCPANYGVASGDFNGDGKLDVVTIDSGSNLNVVLGNGDGTFQAQITKTSLPAISFTKRLPSAISMATTCWMSRCGR